jgi:hypothetical protein
MGCIYSCKNSNGNEKSNHSDDSDHSNDYSNDSDHSNDSQESNLNNKNDLVPIPFVPPITSGTVIKVYDGDTITITSKLPYFL